MSLRRAKWVPFTALALLVACTTPQSTRNPESLAALDCGVDIDLAAWNTSPDWSPRAGAPGPQPLRDIAAAPMCGDLFAKSSLSAQIRLLPQAEADALMKEMWKEQQLRDEFDLEDSMAFWGTLMGKEKVEAALERGQHPIEVYGDRTARNWRLAYRMLEEIPVGELKLSHDLVSKVNHRINNDLSFFGRFAIASPLEAKDADKRGPLWRAVNKQLRNMERHFILDGGRFRKRQLSHNYLVKPMPESEFQHLKAHESLHGMTFWELPWSRPGKRFGLVRYPPVSVTSQKFAKLLEDTNREIEDIKAGRSKKDPIALAAEFQWMFVALHPMTNGNGRTSRALMNRILAEFGLPPSLRSDINLDYGLPMEEHVRYVRDGIVNYLERFSSEPSVVASIYGRGFGLRMNAADLAKLAGETIPPELLVTPKNARKADPTRAQRDLIPHTPEQVMYIDKKAFTFGDDGFYHDNFHVPYVARRNTNGWKLYPVPERTYALYALGGPLNNQRTVKRDLAPATREQVQQDMKLFLAIRKGEVALGDIQVEPYATIKEARETDSLYIYPWQTPMVLASVRIDEDPERNHPLEVLVRNRGDNTEDPRLGRSALEKAFFEGKKAVDPGMVTGHYMSMYLHFEKVRLAAMDSRSGVSSSAREAILREIDASQAKLHAAARKLLAPFLETVQQARSNPAAMAYLGSHPEFRVMWEYLERSPLIHSSIELAWKAGLRNQVPVVRSASTGSVDFWGLTSDADQRRLLYRIPGVGDFVRQLSRDLKAYISEITQNGQIEPDPTKPSSFSDRLARKLAPKFAANPKLKGAVDHLLKFVLVHPHEYRSIDDEAAADFITDFIHAQLDLGPKERLSTTVNPVYVLRPDDEKGIYKGKFADVRPSIYIIMADIERVAVDNASRFTVQDEIRIPSMGRREARRRIIWQMRSNENDVFPVPEGPVPPEAQVVLERLREMASGLEAAPRTSRGTSAFRLDRREEAHASEVLGRSISF